MPANIEIKARARNFADLQRRAEAFSDTPAQVIPQEDTFFQTARGRLKLRQLAPDLGQLVYYERTDASGPKRSDYILARTSEPSALKAALTAALGVRGIIRKRRSLYLVGQTRLHLDEVEGLGEFMELEVVLRPEQSNAEGQAIARDLMTRLGVREEDLLEGAYMDLLEGREGK
jgi:adenylate cyclase